MQSTSTTNKSTQRSLQHLNELLNQYGADFQAWTESDHCALSVKEIAILKSYAINETHLAYATTNNYTKKHVANAYISAKRKLSGANARLQYNRWRQLTYLQQQGLAAANYDPTTLALPVSEYKVNLPTLVQFIQDNSIATTNQCVPTVKKITQLDYLMRQPIHRKHLCIHFYVALE